jgi:hypothetical protein
MALLVCSLRFSAESNTRKMRLCEGLLRPSHLRDELGAISGHHAGFNPEDHVF